MYLGFECIKRIANKIILNQLSETKTTAANKWLDSMYQSSYALISKATNFFEISKVDLTGTR